jgi:exopolyphosphatase/guanosine-5'-triphosphate,3'-diphosphate pyrophosphatase
MHRRRSEESVSRVEAAVENGSLKLRFAPGWLDAHALTRADLEQEAVYLKAANMRLKFK